MDSMAPCPNSYTLRGLTDCMASFGHWIGSLANTELEYLNSDEYIDETMTANGYEFNELGGPE